MDPRTRQPLAEDGAGWQRPGAPAVAATALLAAWLVALGVPATAAAADERAPAAEAAQPPPLPKFDKITFAKLRAGRVIAQAQEDGDGSDARGAVRGWAIGRCTPDATWAVLTDHAKFPEFIPRVEKMEISRRTPTGERAVQTIDASVSTLRYALDYQWDRATGRIEFHLVEDLPHDLKAARGGWQIWPLDGGKATLLEYRSAIDTGRAIPGFVRSYLEDRAVKDTLEAVRKRAEPASATPR